MKRWLTLMAAFVLAAAVAQAFLFTICKPAQWQAAPRDSWRVADLRGAIPGWRVRDLPVGDSEMTVAMVRSRLNYTEYVYRRYSKDDLYFDIYVVRWNAGTLPVWQAVAHTPDRCWTESGWRCLEATHRRPFMIDDEAIFPGEKRLFVSPGGEQVYVWYWHLIDGRPYEFSDRFNDTPSPWRRFRDLWDELRRGDPPQRFVRISGSCDLAQLARHEEFRSILRSLQLSPARG